MRTKAIDIARTLGISKAAVSLALNGKPGVSEKTRREVLECRRQLEETGTFAAPASEQNGSMQQIKVVRIINGMRNVRETELDLWTDVNRVFEENLRANGYTLGLIYVDLRTQDPSAMIQECNREDVSGVVIFGTELKEENIPILESIHKPLVIYDAVPRKPLYPVVVIDNRQGVELAVNELLEKGNRDIIYLSNPMPMYNYQSRQRGFLEVMKNQDFGDAEERIVPIGSSIEECRQAMLQYLRSSKLPDGFIAESYHVTMGTIMAAQELGIRIPEDVSLIGIDALPRYLTGGIAVTSVRVPHTERAYWTIQLLLKEISHPVKEKCRLYTNCVFVDGESVKRRN
jgi:LacI family transcriptional regulator